MYLVESVRSSKCPSCGSFSARRRALKRQFPSPLALSIWKASWKRLLEGLKVAIVAAVICGFPAHAFLLWLLVVLLVGRLMRVNWLVVSVDAQT